MDKQKKRFQHDLRMWYEVNHAKYHEIWHDKVAWVLSDTRDPYWMWRAVKG